MGIGNHGGGQIAEQRHAVEADVGLSEVHPEAVSQRFGRRTRQADSAQMCGRVLQASGRGQLPFPRDQLQQPAGRHGGDQVLIAIGPAATGDDQFLIGVDFENSFIEPLVAFGNPQRGFLPDASRPSGRRIAESGVRSPRSGIPLEAGSFQNLFPDGRCDALADPAGAHSVERRRPDFFVVGGHE